MLAKLVAKGLDLDKQKNIEEAARKKQLELEEARKKKIEADRKRINDEKKAAAARVVDYLAHSIEEAHKGEAVRRKQLAAKAAWEAEEKEIQKKELEALEELAARTERQSVLAEEARHDAAKLAPGIECRKL